MLGEISKLNIGCKLLPRIDTYSYYNKLCINVISGRGITVKIEKWGNDQKKRMTLYKNWDKHKIITVKKKNLEKNKWIKLREEIILSIKVT